jgi:hypothetical protein
MLYFESFLDTISIRCGTSVYRVAFLGAFAKLQKATISFVMSVCPSVRMQQFGSHSKDFDKNLIFEIFGKSVEKI